MNDRLALAGGHDQRGCSLVHADGLPFVQSLPKNSNGKVLKTHLRTIYAAPTPTPAAAAKPSPTPKDRT